MNEDLNLRIFGLIDIQRKSLGEGRRAYEFDFIILNL